MAQYGRYVVKSTACKSDGTQEASLAQRRQVREVGEVL